MDEWEKFNQSSLPEEEEFYRNYAKMTIMQKMILKLKNLS